MTVAAAKALLQVRGLGVARGGVPLLSGIDFTLHAGQAMVVRGPNGAGKTTLLRTLAGLQPPSQGQITIAPDDAVYAAHLDGVKAMLTVQENLDFWCKIYDQPAGDALAQMNLAALGSRLAGTLSAGQKRRLGLARLLVCGRKLWILDEPTVSLDAASVALLEGAVQRHLAGQGAAIIATHVDFAVPAQLLDVSRHPALAHPFDPGQDEVFL